MDPEEYLLMDENVPTSAMSTDDEIIEAVLSSKRENEDEVGEDDDCCSAPQQSISKEKAFEYIDKLQMYFEQCTSLSGGPTYIAFEALSKLRGELTLTSDVIKTKQTTLDNFFTCM